MLYNYNFVITTIIFITSFLHHLTVPNMAHMWMLGVLHAYIRTNKQTNIKPHLPILIWENMFLEHNQFFT